MNLKKQTIAGLFWTFSQQFSVQVINVVVGIFLARILMPAVFGLIGMLTVFIAIGNYLLDSGMTSSLIRTNDADQRDYSTIFFINIFLSITLYIILFFCAPLIASFYHQPLLTSVIRIYSISFVITGFVGVQTTKLTKELRFKEQMFMQLPSTIVGGIVGLILAEKGFGVWSLVWMNLVQSSLFTIQHWLFAGWMPSLIIDMDRLKYHLNFGYKLTITGLIDTIYSNIYKIVIGKFFSVSELGYYTQAKNLQMLPVTNISTALNKVTYPMFSSIKDDDVRLKNAYRRLLHQVVFWIAPLMVLGIITARPLFIVFLTVKWLPAVPYFQILCISGILYPFHIYNLNILNVKGRSDLFLKLEIVKKAFITIGVAISVFFGIYALLIFQIISSIFAFGVNTFYSGKFIDYPGLQQIKEMSPSLIISAVTGVVVWVLNNYVCLHFGLSNILSIIFIICVYGFVYLGLSFFYRVPAMSDFRQLLIPKLL